MAGTGYQRVKPIGYRLTARLAQSVERQTLNLVVVGSSPTVGVHLFTFLIFAYFSIKLN